MGFQLGDNLKKYRLQKGLTQEQLAEILTVSPQAVSRWEHDAAYPDITLLPAIANFYDISLDELMGMEAIRQSARLNDIFRRGHDYRRQDMLDEAVSLYRDALRIYPNHYGLLSELALTITLQCRSAPDPALLDEAIVLSERVLQGTASDKCKSTTKANLCCLYLQANQPEKARELIRSLPHIWESRELMWPETFDDAAYPAACKEAVRKCIQVLYDKIRHCEEGANARPDYMLAEGVCFVDAGGITEKLAAIASFLEK